MATRFDLTPPEDEFLRAATTRLAELVDELLPRLTVLAVDLELALAEDVTVGPTAAMRRAHE